MAILYIVIFAMVSVGLGWLPVVTLDRRAGLTGLERLAAAFLVGVFPLYFAVMAVGPVRYDAGSMWAISGVAALLAVPGWRAVPWADGIAAIRSGADRVRRDPVLLGLAVVTVLVGLSALLQGMAPPNDYDSLLYHLAIPQLDLERGAVRPAWDRGLPHAFFPELTGNLVRLVLATAGEPAVQMVTALFGFCAALSAAALTRRMGAGARTQTLAALMVLSCRMVVWEMATPEVEVALTAYAGVALIAVLVWMERGAAGAIILAGLMMGAGLLVKLNGGAVALALGVPIVVGLVRAPGRLPAVLVAAMAGMALFVPHALHMVALTGNPLFPLFNHVFMPGGVDFFDELRGQYGIGRGVFDLLVTPWFFSVQPMQYFDGMVLGAPYLLALAPLALAVRPRWGVAVALFCGTFYVLWFHLLSQQVRFLMPILPPLCAFAAIGTAWLVDQSHGNWRRVAIAVLALLALNQASYVAIYAALRLPPALGLMSAEDFHAKSPTLGGAMYAPCRWLRANISPGDRILSLVGPHSYYCPQAAAQLTLFPDEEKSWLTNRRLPPMARSEFIRRFREHGFRWVMVPRGNEHRRTVSGAPVMRKVDIGGDRLGEHLKDALAGLRPVAGDAFIAIYDGRAVREALGEP